MGCIFFSPFPVNLQMFSESLLTASHFHRLRIFRYEGTNPDSLGTRRENSWDRSSQNVFPWGVWRRGKEVTSKSLSFTLDPLSQSLSFLIVVKFMILTIPKCAIKWHQAHSLRCATVTTIPSNNDSPDLLPQAPANHRLLSVSVNLTFLGSRCAWTYTIFALVCLVCFT